MCTRMSLRRPCSRWSFGTGDQFYILRVFHLVSFLLKAKLLFFAQTKQRCVICSEMENYLFYLLQHNNPYFFSVVGFQSTERNVSPPGLGSVQPSLQYIWFHCITASHDQSQSKALCWCLSSIDPPATMGSVKSKHHKNTARHAAEMLLFYTFGVDSQMCFKSQFRAPL